METQQQQQQQQQYTNNPYETTQNNLTNASIPQSYDQSSYYYSSSSYPYNNASTHQQSYQTNVDYLSYYYPDYSTSYQTLDPNSIHPPGVPPPADAQQTHVPNPHDFYCQSSQGYLQATQPMYRGGGSHGGLPLRGSGRGTFGRHGKGRGGGRGKHATTSQMPVSMKGQVAASKPPPPLAWCEVCRVDCNTLEILEQHRNGKKHQRNVKVLEELQNLSRQLTVQSQQMPMSQLKTEGADRSQFSSASAAPVESKTETAPGSDSADRAEPSVAQPSDISVRNDGFSGRGGFKRKMRGGRGGKWMRASDGSFRPVEPPKPKQVVPLLCDLCNVKCDSQVVYESHLAGKKHLSNVKRFQGHKEAFGEAVQALYPTIPNLQSTSIISPSTSAIPPSTAIIPPLTSITIPNLPSTSVISPSPSAIPPSTTIIPPSTSITIPNLPSTSIISPSTSAVPSSTAIIPPSTSITQSTSFTPSASSIPQANLQGLQNAHALASMMLSQQNLPDPPAAQAALAQLLNQHGIHDTQTLIAQLIPHLLSQLQAPALASSSAAGLVNNTTNFQSQEPLSSIGAEGQNAGVETKTEATKLEH